MTMEFVHSLMHCTLDMFVASHPSPLYKYRTMIMSSMHPHDVDWNDVEQQPLGDVRPFVTYLLGNLRDANIR